MAHHLLGRMLIAVGMLLCGVELVRAQKAAPSTDAPSLKFDKTGPQVGEQVPDLSLHTLKGEEQRLGDAWRGGPALLVTSSLTCPKSRSRWPELKELVEKYENQVNIVIVYVIEAHPVGSVCPYKDVEDITPENQRDGILRKQPKTLEDRLELAAEFKRLLRINTPIVIDNIKDEAWKGLGAAPNLALLVDEKGLVVARSGWFEGKVSQTAIDEYLVTRKKLEEQEEEENKKINVARDQSRKHQDELKSEDFVFGRFHNYLLNLKPEELSKLLKTTPQLVNFVSESEPAHPYSATLLMEAVISNNFEMTKLLLAHGADIKASTYSYESAFLITAKEGNVEMGKLLLAHGADTRYPRTGKSPLHEAALNGHKEFVKLLLDSGVKHDLFSAISLGETEMVRVGLKVDPSRASRPDGASRMPLDYAVANRKLEIAKLLLANGAPVERTKRSRSKSPIHYAIEWNDLEMTELLLAAGSSPDTILGWGEYSVSQSPMHLAITAKNLQIAKLLITYKSDLKARNNYSKTALHTAAESGLSEIVKLLVDASADVHAPQLGYETPCGPPGEEIPTNTTPLHFAAGSGNPETIQVLLDAGAKINAVTKKGETPLMFAVENRRREHEKDEESRIKNVELLIAKGADVNHQTERGESVLDIASKALQSEDARSVQDHKEILELLKKHGAKPGKMKESIPEPKTPSLPVPLSPE